jgi:pimeloyl-ACP methyl ester carboxylesterase
VTGAEGLTLDAWRDGGERFLHRTHSIFYRVAATGPAPALLCIHGFPTASWDWHLLWPTLCGRFATVAALDMIGFGFSAKPRNHGYSIFEQADIHEALLGRLGVRRVHLLAHDYGDTVAQELLARHEERRARGDDALVVESACLLNGGLFPETHRATRAQKLLAGPLGAMLSRLANESTFSRGLAAVFGPRTRPSAAELHDFWRLAAEGDGTSIAHELIGYMEERRRNRARWVGALRETRVPLRLVDGPEDPVSGAHMVARYRELVPNPDVVVLEGIGHYPQVEDPAGVARAFLEFHDRLGTPRAAVQPTNRPR